MTRSDPRLTSLFDQGVQTFGEALKAGVKMQEETARWWSDAFDQQGPMGEFQKRSKAVMAEAIPVAQKGAEEWMRIWEQNYKKGMDLMRHAWRPEDMAAVPVTGEAAREAAQARGQQVWDAGLQFFRESTEVMARANLRMMEAWAEVFRKAADGQEKYGEPFPKYEKAKKD